MKIPFHSLTAISLLLFVAVLAMGTLPMTALAATVGQSCGDTDNNVTTTDVLCTDGSVCTGGFCISTSDLPEAQFRAGGDLQVPRTGTAILDRIQLIANWVFAIFLAISLIYIILAAFQFVTGGGEPTQVSGARQKLIYAIIGIAIGLLVFGIPAIIRSIIV